MTDQLEYLGISDYIPATQQFNDVENERWY